MLRKKGLVAIRSNSRRWAFDYAAIGRPCHMGQQGPEYGATCASPDRCRKPALQCGTTARRRPHCAGRSIFARKTACGVHGVAMRHLHRHAVAENNGHAYVLAISGPKRPPRLPCTTVGTHGFADIRQRPCARWPKQHSANSEIVWEGVRAGQHPELSRPHPPGTER